jgi:hypothetical protein
MAQRRMFSKDITGTDAFLDMPISSQLLYFHLGMEADDDGFIGSPKKILKIVGAGEDDLKILSAKRFILVFPTGVVVIKHWKINNYIQSDRYHETKYIEEKKALITKENGSYTECIQGVSKLDTQYRLGKASLGKANSAKLPFNSFWELYDKKIGKPKSEKKWDALSLKEQKDILDYLPKYIEITPDKKYRKNPETFFNNRSWEDEIISAEKKATKLILGGEVFKC